MSWASVIHVHNHKFADDVKEKPLPGNTPADEYADLYTASAANPRNDGTTPGLILLNFSGLLVVLADNFTLSYITDPRSPL